MKNQYTPSIFIKKFFNEIAKPDGAIVVSDFDGTGGVGFEVGQLDQDGNLTLTKDRIPSTVTIEDLTDPKKRDENGLFHLEDGRVVTKEALFARNNAMNVYARPELVEAITATVESGHPELFIINTGRTYNQLAEMMLQSGVRQDILDKMITVTNHGSELRFGGNQEVISLAPEMDNEDKQFLENINNTPNIYSGIVRKVGDELLKIGVNSYLASKLTMQAKSAYGNGISSIDFHYRALVESAIRESNVDAKTVEETVKNTLQKELGEEISGFEKERSKNTNRLPLEAAEENMLIEIRPHGLNKGAGMEALTKELDKRNMLPESREIIFAGDSMLKNNGKGARTDYPASVFLKSEEESISGSKPYTTKNYNVSTGMETAKSMNIKGKVIYVHHPVDATHLDLHKPDEITKPATDIGYPADYPKNMLPDLVMKTPVQYSQRISESLMKRVDILKAQQQGNVGDIGNKNSGISYN